MSRPFRPKKITGYLPERMCGSVWPHVKKAMSRGWTFYIVSQRRGRCYPKHKVITIPLWVFGREDKEYAVYYIAHELAHMGWGDNEASHGIEFMQRFKLICPEHLQHYELLYKPRNAKAAGITELKGKQNGKVTGIDILSTQLSNVFRRNS